MLKRGDTFVGDAENFEEVDPERFALAESPRGIPGRFRDRFAFNVIPTRHKGLNDGRYALRGQNLASRASEIFVESYQQSRKLLVKLRANVAA